MIRIIIEIPDQEDAQEKDYLEVSRYFEDILRPACYELWFQSELITDSRVGSITHERIFIL
jgi:hypothetical protein